MIVKMKKTTIVCLNEQKHNALEKLQELGVMHIGTSSEKPTTESYKNMEKNVSEVKKTLQALNSRRKNEQNSKFSKVPELDICGLTIEALEDSKTLSKQLDKLKKDEKALAPWGNFSQETMAQITDKGVFIYLCSGSQENIDNLPDNVTVEVINNEGPVLHFAVIASEVISNLPEVQLPKQSLSKIVEGISSLESRVADLDKKLDQLAHEYDRILLFSEEKNNDLEFVYHRDMMQETNDLAYLTGFVPISSEEEIKKVALEDGWAIVLKEPSTDDNVPTLTKVPKIFEISKPIFDFIGIAPGYKEWDISPCFLIFFTIFFGMIVGDAGYGALFLIAAITMKLLMKNEKAKLPLNLLMVLSSSTIIWGALNANYFAIPTDILPEFLVKLKTPMSTLPPWITGIEKYAGLSVDEIVNKNVQYLCFIIAAIHLTLARAWKTMVYFSNKTKALGEIGWGMLVLANFFVAVELIVFNGSLPKNLVFSLIGGGVLLTLISINWKEVGDILNYPFGLIGAFVDVLSYIRLFAVGLSTFYIAKSFNDMGLMLLEVHPVLIVGTILIMLFGHVLNILLACMGVLVHGIRLNTLEFSNHMGLGWSGFVFKPFKKFKNN